MKFDAPSIKNTFVRRSYAIAISPFVALFFVLIMAYELAKAIVRAVKSVLEYELPNNTKTILNAFNYCWIGHDEAVRIASQQKKDKVNNLTNFTVRFK